MRISDWSSDVCSSDLWSLHTVRGDGTDDRVLAAKSDGEAHYFDPDLSSDGERVAATRCTSTSYADGCVIVDIAIDGSDLRVLDLPAAAGMPQDVVWSPDGTQLAFVSRPETAIGRASCRERGCQSV